MVQGRWHELKPGSSALRPRWAASTSDTVIPETLCRSQHAAGPNIDRRSTQSDASRSPLHEMIANPMRINADQTSRDSIVRASDDRMGGTLLAEWPHAPQIGYG